MKSSSGSLAAEGVSFSYGFRRTKVFDHLEWSVPEGATTLLLGSNGAGKSTLLKLLAGVERPTSGRVSLAGHTRRRTLFEQVGWMPQVIRPVRGLTVLEQVEYAAWLAGMHRRDARVRAQAAVEAVDLGALHSRRATELSGGQLRRLGLAQALCRRVHVLLLDEPTAGLDPAQSQLLRGILRGLDVPGGIVVSTHQADELAEASDRLAVLDSGSFRFDGTVAEFKRDHAHGTSVTAAFVAMIGRGQH